MSWYVLQCRTGQEDTIIRSCRQHISSAALAGAFSFCCERLWRSDGIWKLVVKDMFPGYVFLESSRPEMLSEELENYRRILRVMEEPGYLISVYQEEEQYLRKLCGEDHYLKISYGYKDKDSGKSLITNGPLRKMGSQIIKYDWHRRFAQVVISVSGRKISVWAGLGIDETVLKQTARDEGQRKQVFLVS